MEIPNLDKYKKIKKVSTKPWQDLAIHIITVLVADQSQKSSIFKCCKTNEQRAKQALEDCIELNKLSVQYFFKVFYETTK